MNEPKRPFPPAVNAEAERWRQETFDPAAAAHQERKPFVTDVGIGIEPLYTPADLERVGFDYLRDAGFPGEYPFTRGDRPGMNRTEPFVVSAYSGFGDAEACNRRFRKLIEIGTEQILVALDLPTQCGYDSDHEMSTAEVGQVGVAIDTLADMELLFEGIPADSLKRIGTLGNSIGPIVLALYAALGEKQGIPWSRYTVNLQNDPLKEYIARGTQILPPEPAAKLAVDAVAWCVGNAPNWSPMTVCVNHINSGGAGSSMGTAIALANARHYLNLLLKEGYSIDEVAPLLHMFPDERHDFFVSIANLRALRRIWARLMKETYGATRPEAMACRTTVYGPGQGALAVEVRNGDEEILDLVRAIDDPVTRAAVSAERAFLAALGGGCQTPAGALATLQGATLTLRAVIVDGNRRVTAMEQGPAMDPEALGRSVAASIRAQAVN